MVRNELFATKVGSHIWSMNTNLSDIDYFIVYIAPLDDILLQKRPKSRHTIEGTIDMTVHEIGHVINQLRKSNFNFVVGVMSPIVTKDSRELYFLKNWVMNNISKQIYYSIRGLALKNYEDSMGGYNQKKARLVMRTLMFGIHLLRTGEFKFRPIVGTIKAEHIGFYIKELDRAFEESNLPSTVTNFDKLEQWLIDLRLSSRNN